MNNEIKINTLKKTTFTSKAAIKSNTQEASFWNVLNKEITLFGNIVPDKIKEGFYAELGTLLEAGVDIKTALEIISEEQEKKKFKIVFENIAKSIVEGGTLSAILKSTKGFTPYEFQSVKIGEEAGKLVMVLKELGSFYTNKIKQRRQVISAITYPLIVLCVAFAAVSFMLSFVVPMFSDVFKRFGGDLPAITQLVLNLSKSIKGSFWILVFIVFTIIIFCYSQRKKIWFRNFSSKAILRIPLVGKIVQKVYLSRFSNTMALLVGSKVPILQSIDLVKEMINFYPIEKSLQKISNDVLEGEALYKAIAKHKIFPSKLVSLIKVGEEVNQLEIFFTKTANQYANEVEYQTNLLSKFIEPVIIVILGLIVGVILIAMYLPLFKLGQNI